MYSKTKPILISFAKVYFFAKAISSVRLKQHSLRPEYAEKTMKIVINVIPEVFIGNPVS